MEVVELMTTSVEYNEAVRAVGLLRERVRELEARNAKLEVIAKLAKSVLSGRYSLKRRYEFELKRALAAAEEDDDTRDQAG